MELKLPEPSRFKITELSKRWSKTEEQILDMAAAGQLELRAQFFGCFAKYIITEAHTFFLDGEQLDSLDFKLTDPVFIHEIVKHGFIEKEFIRTRIDGKECKIFFYPNANKHPGREVRYPIVIRPQDLYILLTAVLKVEGKSVHRVALEEMFDLCDAEKKPTKAEFAKLLSNRYPDISEAVAKNLFTFINTPLRPHNILE